jgi:hypothetical protein
LAKNNNPAGFIKLKGSKSLHTKLIINHLTQTLEGDQMFELIREDLTLDDNIFQSLF